MRTNSLSVALRDHLGHEATLGLVDLFESEEAVWSDHVLSLAAERYERRLTEEVAGLRVALVREMYDLKWDILKWTFLFWIGQVATFAGLLAWMFRAPGR